MCNKEDKWALPGWKNEPKYTNKVLVGNWFEERLWVGRKNIFYYRIFLSFLFFFPLVPFCHNFVVLFCCLVFECSLVLLACMFLIRVCLLVCFLACLLECLFTRLFFFFLLPCFLAFCLFVCLLQRCLLLACLCACLIIAALV